MYNFLEFIDSSDIREYNQNTIFTPAQQAVLISRSQKKSIEEKIEALEYLVAHYPAEDFSDIVSECAWVQETGKPLKEMVVRTIESWKKILADRFDNSGHIYAVMLNEKSCIRYDLSDHRFFSSYEKAYDGLVSQKRYYLDNEDLRDIETFGEILRIKLNNDTNIHTHCDRYRFDNELKMIWVDGMRESLINEEGHKKSTIEDYIIYLPLPFQEGDIVKVESPFHETFYGVFPREWTKPEKVLHFNMQISLDQYEPSDKTFWYTDDTDILELSFCMEEELPEKDKKLKLISDVRRGKMDFFDILCKSFKEQKLLD